MIEFINTVTTSDSLSACELEQGKSYVVDGLTPDHVKKMINEWNVVVLQGVDDLQYVDEAVRGVWLGSRMILTDDSPCVSLMRFREVNLKVEIQNV